MKRVKRVANFVHKYGVTTKKSNVTYSGWSAQYYIKCKKNLLFRRGAQLWKGGHDTLPRGAECPPNAASFRVGLLAIE